MCENTKANHVSLTRLGLRESGSPCHLPGVLVVAHQCCGSLPRGSKPSAPQTPTSRWEDIGSSSAWHRRLLGRPTSLSVITKVPPPDPDPDPGLRADLKSEFCSFSLSFFFVDNTAWILTRRNSYSSLQKSVYHVPVVISDGEFPMQSSTNTLTVQVCTCDRDGNMKLCNAEALTARAGLSTGALVAILLCVVILLSEWTTQNASAVEKKKLLFKHQNCVCVCELS